jgi:hypothetical protein
MEIARKNQSDQRKTETYQGKHYILQLHVWQLGHTVAWCEHQRTWAVPPLRSCHCSHMASVLGWLSLLRGRHSTFLVSPISCSLLCIFSITLIASRVILSVPAHRDSNFAAYTLSSLSGFPLKCGWRPLGSCNSCILHAAKPASCGQCQDLLPAQAIARPPWTMATVASQNRGGWAWWNESYLRWPEGIFPNVPVP